MISYRSGTNHRQIANQLIECVQRLAAVLPPEGCVDSHARHTPVRRHPVRASGPYGLHGPTGLTATVYEHPSGEEVRLELCAHRELGSALCGSRSGKEGA